nr:sugar-transfer associated ATP-grasp domain-containing protein [Massilia sp. MS-15]
MPASAGLAVFLESSWRILSVKLSRVINVLSEYTRAQLYAVSSIKKPADLHLLWGPLHARTKWGIGAKNFSLYSLADVPRATWDKYLVNEPLKTRYARITTLEARKLADDKVLFHDHCRAHGVATAPILALVTPGERAGTAIPHVYSPAAMARLFVPGRYFLKPSDGSHGKGNFSLCVDADGLHWSGRHGTYEDFFSYCAEILQRTSALIVQPCLMNHQAIRDITHARGLSTIRVVTFRKGDAIDVAAACLRIVVGDSEVDNFSHGESGNLVSAIDVESGRLITAIGSRSRRWPRMVDVPHHPASKARILDVRMPHWDEVIALVRKAHGTIGGLHTVGWDVAITTDGPLIVEANWRYDVDILQVAYKKGFREVIDGYIAT